MKTNSTQYDPISCEYHDLLEVHATVQRTVQIRFRDPHGVVQARNVRLTDVFAQNGAEYLSMSSGETVRLDHLVEVGSARLADYCSTKEKD